MVRRLSKVGILSFLGLIGAAVHGDGDGVGVYVLSFGERQSFERINGIGRAGSHLVIYRTPFLLEPYYIPCEEFNLLIKCGYWE